MILLALIAHLALLGVPLLVAGRRPGPEVLGFLVLATLAQALELGAQAPEREEGEALALASGLALLAVMLTALCNGHPPAWPLAAGGAALMLAGALLRWLAIRELGRHFRSVTGLVGEHRLVTSGVYRWLRHPSETGLLALAGGACALLGSPWAVLPLLLLLAPQVAMRVAREDRLLARAFPEHQAWRRRTPALWPAILTRS